MSPEGGPPPAPVAFPDQEPMRTFVLSAPARPRGRKQTSMITTETLFMAHPTFIYCGLQIADCGLKFPNPQSAIKHSGAAPWCSQPTPRAPRAGHLHLFHIQKRPGACT